MSFAQQLGRVTSSARDNFVQETLQRLMVECQNHAAQGLRESFLALEQPSYFHEQKAALQGRLDAMGFDTCHIHEYDDFSTHRAMFEIQVVWKVESPEPEAVWQQGTHQFRQSPMCRQGTRAPKALPW
ncbi:unnamed protein product [Cladocopium goreaui]|uniref:Uncharacterized protein n=1 Tax=Cladocopium goreaui TaxID=2562237 RepID=A0A9P1D6Z3_9DINO|nr:unnamed protein product [Cladocopium goreaui]|mmetsp:Transcript_50381/g.109773  ORF Transcript_50381/g.109773 Transcript_50381/m.109773 type:complete len:128 (-) Transcript_50381:326-709(-)